MPWINAISRIVSFQCSAICNVHALHSAARNPIIIQLFYGQIDVQGEKKGREKAARLHQFGQNARTDREEAMEAR